MCRAAILNRRTLIDRAFPPPRLLQLYNARGEVRQSVMASSRHRWVLLRGPVGWADGAGPEAGGKSRLAFAPGSHWRLWVMQAVPEHMRVLRDVAG